MSMTHPAPVCRYTRLLDLCLAALLSALAALLPRPPTLPAILGKAAAIVTAALALAVHVLLVQPYAPGPEHGWKGPVRALLLLLTAACACLNALAACVDAGFDVSTTAVSGCAYAVLAVFVIAAVVLVGGVIKAMVAGVRLHSAAAAAQRQLQATLRSQAEFGVEPEGPSLAVVSNPLLASADGMDQQRQQQQQQQQKRRLVLPVGVTIAADTESADAWTAAPGHWQQLALARQRQQEAALSIALPRQRHGTGRVTRSVLPAATGVSSGAEEGVGLSLPMLLSPLPVRQRHGVSQGSTRQRRAPPAAVRSVLKSRWAAALSVAVGTASSRSAHTAAAASAAHAALLDARYSLQQLLLLKQEERPSLLLQQQRLGEGEGEGGDGVISTAEARVLASQIASLLGAYGGVAGAGDASSSSSLTAIAEVACEALAALLQLQRSSSSSSGCDGTEAAREDDSSGASIAAALLADSDGRGGSPPALHALLSTLLGSDGSATPSLTLLAEGGSVLAAAASRCCACSADCRV